jgi:hypothetical protein
VFSSFVKFYNSSNTVYYWLKMKTCSLSETKSSLGKLADEAHQGHPTVISRGGKLLILKAYEPSDPGEFDALTDEGIKSEHFPLTGSVWAGIRQRGRALAQK